MKNPKKISKLTLQSQTVRRLAPPELKAAVGGFTGDRCDTRQTLFDCPETEQSGCWTHTVSCGASDCTMFC